VSVDLVLLALACTVRPTSLTAVYALLAHDRRRMLMVAYLVGGLLFTVAFGLLVVYGFHGIHAHGLSPHTKAIADIAGGTVALAFGVATLSGRARRPHTDDVPVPASGRLQMMLDRSLSVRTAVIAGPVTHVPGVFYLIALNGIVAHHRHVVAGTSAVLIYNAIWYALPITALVFCIVRPGKAVAAVESVQARATEHSRAIVLTVSFGVGALLVIRGALAL
jgi:hypothetical protein